MELIQAIALLCQINISNPGSRDYPTQTGTHSLKCQQYYMNCVSKHRAKLGAVDALERCILEK